MLSSVPCKLWHSKRLIKIIAIIIITIWYVHIYQYLEWSSSTLHNQRIHWLFIKHLLKAWCISQGQLGYFAITNIPIVSVTQNNKVSFLPTLLCTSGCRGSAPPSPKGCGQTYRMKGASHTLTLKRPFWRQHVSPLIHISGAKTNPTAISGE